MRHERITLKTLLMGTYPLPGLSFDNFFSNFEPSDTNRVIIALLRFLNSSQRIGVTFVCLRPCIVVGSFFVFVILAGPSIGGQTAADELLKTSSLYFITAFITWATLHKRSSIDAPLQIERPQNVEGQDTDNHTGDHRGELGTALVKCYYHDDRRVSNEHLHIMRETRV